ncbi:MAG: ferric reductase-like transmembrane domain-containing protein [Chloroflexi bacterium]|nr:ferric reductase-like transmembrane domain-containing protein [Chloroflexota bacterium]
MNTTISNEELDSLPPAMALHSLLLMLMAVALGAFAAAIALPAWLPGLSASLLGSAPKAYWYLSRSSAFIAYILLWLSMALGLIITNKMARVWPGGPTAFDLHQHASLLGLAFALFHGLILMGDKYINYTLRQVLLPFASVDYRPLWVGVGQIGFYLLALVGLSFYARRQMGNRLWRLIHYLSFAVFALALLHGLMSGTDSATTWARSLYWTSGGSLLFLTVYRVLASMVMKPASKRAQIARASPATQPPLPIA